jgi:hypothetical protein
MPFDFSAIRNSKQKIIDAGTPKLICVLGVRGAGKSSLIGTAPKDKNTLILMTQSECHSYASARGIAVKKYGNADHLTPFFLDEIDGKYITGDVVVSRLIELLTDANTFKYFPIICLDSLASLDSHLLACSELASADKFGAGRVANAIYSRIFAAIKGYVAQGGVLVYTLPTEVYNDDNGVAVSTPKLRGTSAVNSILGESPVIVRAERITAIDENGKSITEFALAFKGGAISKKKSKILSMTGSGKDLKITAVPMTLNFSCRIAGLAVEKTPDIMPADLEGLLQLIDNNGTTFTEEGAQ